MIMTDKVDKLAVAIVTAQAELENVTKDKKNPHFHSSYADLASVWDAVRESLAKNELSVIQTLAYEDGVDFLETTLLHKSGQSITGRQRLIFKRAVNIKGPQGQNLGKEYVEDMQTAGSAITYARRYGVMAILGIAPEGDDGNAVAGNAPRKQTPQQSAIGPQKYTGGIPEKFRRGGTPKTPTKEEAAPKKEEPKATAPTAPSPKTPTPQTPPTKTREVITDDATLQEIYKKHNVSFIAGEPQTMMEIVRKSMPRIKSFNEVPADLIEAAIKMMRGEKDENV